MSRLYGGVPGRVPSPNPNPMALPPQVASPMYRSASPQPQPMGVNPSQISPDTITYTTSYGPDGQIVYHPFRAVPVNYQTPQGIVAGTQWVPAEATTILPSGAQPANPDFSQNWAKKQFGHDDRALREWQRSEEKRRRKEEKHAAKRLERAERDRREREREDKEARRAERDARRVSDVYGGQGPPGGMSPAGGYMPSPAAGYSPYAPVNELTGRMDTVNLGGNRGSFYGDSGGMPRSPIASYTSPPTVSHGPPSPYRGGGALPGRSASPIPPSGISVAPMSGGMYAAPRSRAPSPQPGMPGGNPYGAPTPGAGVYGAPGSNAYGAPGTNAYGAPNVPGSNPYGAAPGTGPYGPHSRAPSPQPAPYGPPRSRAASPQPGYGGQPSYGGQSSYAGQGILSRPGGSPMPSNAVLAGDQNLLQPPDGFARPPNLALSYTWFDLMKIQHMDDFYESLPRMPLVLVPHDVYHEDWIRFMTDLALAWAGKLPSAGTTKGSTLAMELIDLWNTAFFHQRGVDIILFRGRERRTGKHAGQIESALPGHDDETDDSEDSSSSLSDDSDLSDSDRDYRAQPSAYYGRPEDAYQAEMRDAKRRAKDKKAEKRRKHKEKKARRKAKERERRYSLYIACLTASDG